MTTITELILDTPLGKAIKNSIAVQLSNHGLREIDTTFYPGSDMSSRYRDRYDYDRKEILEECLHAWRVNLIARRIVKLISMFVVGEGINVHSDHKANNDYLQTWWNHPLNGLGRKCISFCDEATRSGNLFFLCTVDSSTGMLYLREMPAEQVDEIITAPNDVDQELAYKPIAQGAPNWPAYNLQSAILYASLRLQPAGRRRLERTRPGPPASLAASLFQLARRSRPPQPFPPGVHIYRQGHVSDKASQAARQRELNMNPPPPGSILVTNENETWSVIAPELASAEVGEDGLALKKMIAIGAGLQTHYLADPESSTRTTAEAAGTPTFRGLEQTQTFFLDILSEITPIAVAHRQRFESARYSGYRQVDPESTIQATGSDITERDNSTLALAVSRVYPAFSELFDREGIGDEELLRVVYKMAGEAAPTPSRFSPAPHMQRRPLRPLTPAQPRAAKASTASDPTTPPAENS